MAEETQRILTDEESSQLRTQLSSLLQDGTSEDANDLLDYALAMISNGKSVQYIVNDLKNMGMDHICDENASGEIGEAVDDFLKRTDHRDTATDDINETMEDKTETDNNITNANDDTSTKTTKRVISLKSTAKNALTMSGALGSGKKENKKNSGKDTAATNNKKEKGNALTMSGALGSSRIGNNKNDKKDTTSPKPQSKQKQKQNQQGKKNLNQKKKTGRPGGRSIATEAFKKLAQQRDNDRNQQSSGRGRGRGNRAGRGDFGNSGRGRGRDNEERNSGRGRHGSGPGPGGGRDGGRGDRNPNAFRNSGQKRTNDGIQNNERFDQYGTNGQNNFHGGGGRGDQNFGRGRGRGQGRSQPHDDQNKRPRYENQIQQASESYHATSYNEWHAGSFRGRGQVRGRGRGRGNTNESTQAAAEASPSPLVAAEFGTKLSYGGRGPPFQGGRGFRGRGFAGRSHVTALLAAKTWKRPKPDADGQTVASSSEQVIDQS